MCVVKSQNVINESLQRTCVDTCVCEELLIGEALQANISQVLTVTYKENIDDSWQVTAYLRCGSILLKQCLNMRLREV